MNRSFLIQKKFGCICVSDTKVASDNCIKQEIYLIPMRKDNGNTVNDDFIIINTDKFPKNILEI